MRCDMKRYVLGTDSSSVSTKDVSSRRLDLILPFVVIILAIIVTTIRLKHAKMKIPSDRASEEKMSIILVTVATWSKTPLHLTRDFEVKQP